MLARARAHNQLARTVYQTRKRTGQATDQRQASDFFRVSSTFECDRKLYYGRTGAKIWTPFTPRTREKMELGDLLHDHIRGVLIPRYTPWYVKNWNPEVLMDMDYHVRIPILDARRPKSGTVLTETIKVNLSGHPDGQLWRQKLQKSQAMLEVKTTNTFSYRKTTNLGFQDPTHWSKSYLIQGNRYGNIWNRLHPKEKVPALCVLVYNVNGDEDKITHLPWRDYWFKLDKAVFAMDLRRLATIERSIRDGQVPERYYQKPDWQCRGCFYHRLCWEEDWKKEQVKAKQPRRSRTRPAGSSADSRQISTVSKPSRAGDVSR